MTTSNGDDRLKGWKEIATYLHTSDRTVQRWERSLGLPVQRVESAKASLIFASRAQLDRWLESAEGRQAMAERPAANGVASANAHVSTVETRTAGAADQLIEPAVAVASAHQDAAVGGPVVNTPRVAPSPTAQASPAEAARLTRRSPALILLTLWLVAATILLSLPLMRPSAGNLDFRVARAVMAAGSAKPSTSRQSTRIRLMMENGHPVKLSIAAGGSASITIPSGESYAFRVERDHADVRLHIDQAVWTSIKESPRYNEVASMPMQAGTAVPITQIKGVASIELLAPLPTPPSADPAKAAAR